MVERERADVISCLVLPPLTDPTGPYHSISYLVGFARARGFTSGAVLDANIEALNFASAPTEVGKLLRFASDTIQRVEGSSRLTVQDQLSYRLALQVADLSVDDIPRAISALRDDATFFDYGSYRVHAHKLRRWFRSLALFGTPGQYLDFRVNPYGPGNPSRTSDLTDQAYIADIVRPFQPYFEGPFKQHLLRTAPHVIGFSVTYRSQLWFAIWLAARTREWLPGTKVCFGGADVADLYKNLDNKTKLFKVLCDVDYAVIGEGEIAWCSILDHERTTGFSPLSSNVVTRANVALPRTFEYSNLDAIGAPAYDIWDFHKYWSPEPFVLYAPTRGCYWNKCTFCDYGLNFNSPTSPSRNRSIEKIRSDLRDIARLTPYVYFSVDAISPSHLQKICNMIDEEGIRIHWAGELRLEKRFRSSDLTAVLKRGGCVSISFGYESATQRLLDLIDKGVDIQLVPELLSSLRNAGIAAQMMGFVGFPSESFDEGLETYQFLQRHDALWSLAGIGEFTLTSGSIVAQRPEKFGVSYVASPGEDDTSRLRLWSDPLTGALRGMGATQKLYSAHSECVRRSELDRPFVGGIDSAHTIFYLHRFGFDVFRNQIQAYKSAALHQFVELESPFAAIEDFADVEGLFWRSASELSKGRSLGLKEYRELYRKSWPTSHFKSTKNVTLRLSLNGAIRVKQVTF